jgi:hypothetical protein
MLGGKMNMLERFITPRMVTRYYDRTILLSPLFVLLTAVFIATSLQAVRLLHGWKEITLVMVPIVSVWLHLIVQHRWFRNVEDVQKLKENAARTTVAFGVLYVVTVGILLSYIPR